MPAHICDLIPEPSHEAEKRTQLDVRHRPYGRSTNGVCRPAGRPQVACGSVARTFTIITTNANAIIVELHDRMLTIFEPSD
jgi:hypothetical protein